MTAFDLNILPLHRLNGQEMTNLPGLLALAPSRKAARERMQDSLVLYFMLSGNARVEAHEIEEWLQNAAHQFYQWRGSLTAAMRKAAESLNTALLERNLSTTGRGQYALGLLVIASTREARCTLLLSGPAHAVWISEGQSRHFHDPALSGKGLGSSQSLRPYFSQVELHHNDLLVLSGKFPKEWEADLMNERPPASLEASYRKLMFAKGDLHAALIQAQSGRGNITLLRPANSPISSSPISAPPISAPPFPNSPTSSPPSEKKPPSLADFPAHVIQPSAYAIPPRTESLPTPTEEKATVRSFPPSIPRAKSVDIKIEAASKEEKPPAKAESDAQASSSLTEAKPGAHAEAARQMAKAVVKGIRTGRRVNERLGDLLRRFVPRIIPNTDSTQALTIPTYAMVFMAIIIPVLVVTIATVVYLRFGQSVQYDELYRQALAVRAQAVSEADPIRQRDLWNQVLSYVDQAERYRETDESRLLRSEAQSNLDALMGVLRLEFIPSFTGGLGGSTQISRMAASESDLYMLDAEGGNILHASFTGRSLQFDSAFNCQPGTYAGYQVGTLVDIAALPKVNTIGATVMGLDTGGTLLYCAPGQIPQAVPLPPLPNTNWVRITAFALDNDRLYVLDAGARAVWVFPGKDSAFLDAPYFFFGNQIPNIENAIDLAVNGDDLYLLHSDGHLSTCTFSRVNGVPTRCQDPAPFVDNFPAHQDLALFAQAHFTQIALTSPPNVVLLLLDSENRNVYRFSPRSLELQNMITGFAGKANPFQAGPFTAMTVSPNYVLYVAIGNQVYFTTSLP